MKNSKNAHSPKRVATLKSIVLIVVSSVVIGARSLGAFSLQIASPDPNTTQIPIESSATDLAMAGTVQPNGQMSVQDMPAASGQSQNPPQNSTVTTTQPRTNQQNTGTQPPASPINPIAQPTAPPSGSSSNPTAPPPPPPPEPTPAPAPPPPPPPTYQYRNGTYYAEGPHSTPAGTERIGIYITVNNDVVTATNATNLAANGTSRAYQSDFIANYSGQVVGKQLSSLNLGKIAGASLTTNGFNTAASAIRSQAD